LEIIDNKKSLLSNLRTPNKIINFRFKEIIAFFILYFSCIFVEYFTFRSLSNSLFLFLLVLFWFSNKDYFWIAFFFFLIESPGYVLTSFDALHHLPDFNLIPGFGRRIGLFELFIILALVKAVMKKSGKLQLFFKRPLIAVVGYILFLFGLSFIFGIDNMRVFRTIRCLMPFTLIYSGYKLLAPNEGYSKFFRFLFPVVFYVISVQVFEIIVSTRLAFYIGGISSIETDMLFEARTGAARLLYSYYLITVAFIGAMFYLSYKKKIFKRPYLYSILAACLLSILFSATRGIFLSLVAMLICYFLFVSKKTVQTIIKAVVPIFIMIALINMVPVLKKQYENAFKRIETIQYLMKGDITAGGTMGRLNVRGPRVLKKVSESLIVGFGFSNSFWDYHDNHVGHYTMLLNGGIIGALIFLLFIIYFLLKLYGVNRKLQTKNSYKNTPLVIIVAFFGLFIWHSTSNAIFSYIISWINNGWGFTLAFFFAFANYIFNASIKEEIALRSAEI